MIHLPRVLGWFQWTSRAIEIPCWRGGWPFGLALTGKSYSTAGSCTITCHFVAYRPMKLIIRNLDRSTTEDEVKTLFEKFGAVQSCDLVIDKVSGGSKGFAFVEIPHPGEAKAAMKSLNGTTVSGSKIRVKKAVKKAESQPDAPSRPDDGPLNR